MRISTKTLSLMAVSLFAVGLAAGASGGCGGSSSTDYVGLCTRSCNKYQTCSGTTGLNCSSICASAANKSSCPNADQVAAGANTCLAMADCTAYLNCAASAPTCGSSGGPGSGGSTGTTGTGGSSSATGTGGHTAGAAGTTGSTGAAGSGGTADCSICDKANNCCMAEAPLIGQPTSSCTLSASACTASGSGSASYAMSCQQLLTAGQSLSLAACQ